jgi:hypothetical protein
MSKLQYTKPSVTRIGSVVVKTEGYWVGTTMELWSVRQ